MRTLTFYIRIRPRVSHTPHKRSTARCALLQSSLNAYLHLTHSLTLTQATTLPCLSSPSFTFVLSAPATPCQTTHPNAATIISPQIYRRTCALPSPPFNTRLSLLIPYTDPAFPYATMTLLATILCQTTLPSSLPRLDMHTCYADHCKLHTCTAYEHYNITTPRLLLSRSPSTLLPFIPRAIKDYRISEEKMIQVEQYRERKIILSCIILCF